MKYKEISYTLSRFTHSVRSLPIALSFCLRVCVCVCVCVCVWYTHSLEPLQSKVQSSPDTPCSLTLCIAVCIAYKYGYKHSIISKSRIAILTKFMTLMHSPYTNIVSSPKPVQKHWFFFYFLWLFTLLLSKRRVFLCVSWLWKFEWYRPIIL